MVVVVQVGRLLGRHQDDRGAGVLEPGRQRHRGVAGGLENDGHRRIVGDLGPQALEICGRRAESSTTYQTKRTPVGQAGPVVGLRGHVDADLILLHGVDLFRWTD